MRQYEATGNTVEEAIAKARAEMGIGEDVGIPEILQYPKKGFFGKIKTPARVRLTVEDDEFTLEEARSERPAVKSEPKKEAVEERKPEKPVQKPRKEQPVKEAAPVVAKEESKEEKEARPAAKEETSSAEEALKEPSAELMPKVQVAEAYLREVFDKMGASSVTATFLEGANKTIYVRLEGNDIGSVIGKRGETLDAIQYLVCLVANRLEGDYIRFTLNAGNYREKREETLKALAARMAKKVLKTGRPAALEPMNPYERRIIHSVVTEIEGVYSKSSGEEPNRKVVIKPSRQQGGYRRNDRKGSYNRSRNQREEKKSSSVSSETTNKEPKELNDNIKLYSKIEL